MARLRTATDAFSALAEPRRRVLLGALAKGWQGERDNHRDVSWLVNELGWPQPQVSKHLGVLRKAGLVSVERRGRHRVYSVKGAQLRSVFEWVKAYERFWDHQLDRIRQRAEQAGSQRRPHHSGSDPERA